MNSCSQMQGDKNWVLPKEINVTDSLGLSLAGNLEKPLCSSMGPNGGSVAMDSDLQMLKGRRRLSYQPLSGRSP
jgi:hypothetical protein